MKMEERMRKSCVLSVLALVFLAASPSVHAQRGDFSFWTQITASDATAGAGFGREVTLSADGTTALVSAGMGDCSVSPCAPAAYVFVRDRGGWIQQAKLPAPGNPPGETNLRIALSGDGNIALLGVAGVGCALGGRCGAVYVFSRSGTDWTLQQTLHASDPRAQGYFGVGVAISEDGDTALISSIGASCGTPSSCGAVYVFTRSGSVWTERQKLLEPSPGPFFGRSIALSGDGNTALAVGGGDLGTFFSGRVYVFTRNGDVWSLQSTIFPPVGVNDFASTEEAISADGNIILVRGGADNSSGSVFVFIRTGATWTQEAVLPGSSPTYPYGGSFDLTDDGQTALVVSRPGSCAPAFSCGPVDVFSRNGGAWDHVQQFAPPGLAAGAFVGSVSLSGDGTTALLGVPDQPCSAGARCGAAYLFTSAPLAVGIPTLDGAGLALLTLALAVGALIVLQRRRFI
jgi:hypothetical protein